MQPGDRFFFSYIVPAKWEDDLWVIQEDGVSARKILSTGYWNSTRGTTRAVAPDEEFAVMSMEQLRETAKKSGMRFKTVPASWVDFNENLHEDYRTVADKNWL
tara:strand:+ start:224 stop:532 length:309 start_codon:yes stop_codon:yes gene_type:complete